MEYQHLEAGKFSGRLHCEILRGVDLTSTCVCRRDVLGMGASPRPTCLENAALVHESLDDVEETVASSLLYKAKPSMKFPFEAPKSGLV